MAEQRLEVHISADVSELQRALGQMQSDTNRAMDNVSDDVDKTEKSVKRSTKSMGEAFQDLGHRINESLRNVGGLMKGALLILPTSIYTSTCSF